MTTLKIIPDFENKTAECIGCPSAGEHVDVRIVGAANLLPSSTLRFRVKFGHVTLALFPRPGVNESWETEGSDLKCHLNLNTVQARSVCRTGNTVCHAILDQLGDDEHTVEPTLFFDDLFDVTPWHREPGHDEPYDLDRYPDQIAYLNLRVDAIGTKISEAKAAAQAAQGSANAAYESARSAVESAQNSNARANAAESAARGSAVSAERAERALAEMIGKLAAKSLPKHLYELSYDDTYPADAAWLYAQLGPSELGRCSAVRRGGKLWRNYDWTFDSSAEFAVRVSGSETRFASVGMASVGSRLNENDVASGVYSRYYRCLPGMVLDGINEKGVVCEINVDGGPKTGWHGDAEDDGIHILAAVRWVLDHGESARQAAAWIADHIIQPTGYMNFHFMVADATATYIVENGVYSDYTEHNTKVLTNFAVFDPAHAGSGFERYGILAGGADIRSVWFTKAYEVGNTWHSDFESPEQHAAAIAQWAAQGTDKEAHRGKTTTSGKAWWQSVHTTEYDFAAKTMKVAVQEQDEWFTFAVDAQGVTDVAWEDVKDKPQTFPPSDHTHQQGDVAGLLDALAAKVDTQFAETIPAGAYTFTNGKNGFQAWAWKDEDDEWHCVCVNMPKGGTGPYFDELPDEDCFVSFSAAGSTFKDLQLALYEGTIQWLWGSPYCGEFIDSEEADIDNAVTTSPIPPSSSFVDNLSTTEARRSIATLIADPVAPSGEAYASGKPADAKATGDALAERYTKGEANELFDEKMDVSAKVSDLRDEAGKPTSINRLKLLADGKLMSETKVQTGWGTIMLDRVSDDFVAYDSNAMPYTSLPPIGEWKGPFGEEWGSSYRFYVPASDSDPTSDDEATLGKWCIFALGAGWNLMYSQSAYAAIPSIEAAEFTNASAGSPAPYAICGHAHFTRDPIAETRTREFAETTQAVLSVPLTDGAETMAQIKARLDAINADGKHVLFDVASIVTTPQLYLCTIFIDTTANILRIADLVTGKMYIGNYVATDTLSGVLSRAVDAYVRISVAATTKDINPSTGTTYPVVGQTVYLHEGGDATGPVRETATYDGSPVSFMVPKGFRYHVSLSNGLQGHFNPHAVPAGTESGTANANIDIAFEYDDFSTVDTFAGIQAALLNFDKDDPESINAARSALVGKVIEDTWVDLDVSNANGDATPARDAAGHPVWRDPTVVIDVRVVEDADGNTHLGAVMMRQYATRYQIPFDNPNKELAEEDNALDGVYYYGFAPDYDPGKTYAKNACVRQGSTIYAALAAIATPEAWTVEHWKVVTEPQDGNSTELLTLTVGDPIPYASYNRIYRNSLRDTTKNIVVYGHNRYEVSAYRQYLNSDANKNEWWEQKHIGQTKPGAASSYHGYLAGCSAAILAAAKAVKHVCSANTVTDGGGSYEVCDRFYLPSVREFFGTSNTAENDTPYNYWRALLDDPDAEPNNNDGTDPVGPINSMRKMKAIHSKSGSVVHCRLRSAYTGNSYGVWNVYTSGYLSGNYANSAYAASPACAIY